MNDIGEPSNSVGADPRVCCAGLTYPRVACFGGIATKKALALLLNTLTGFRWEGCCRAVSVLEIRRIDLWVEAKLYEIGDAQCGKIVFADWAEAEIARPTDGAQMCSSHCALRRKKWKERC